jgi:hypothetical protein
MFRWHLALEGDAVLDQGAKDKLFEPYVSRRKDSHFSRRETD